MIALAYAGICFAFIGGFFLIAFCHASGTADDADARLIRKLREQSPNNITHGDIPAIPPGYRITSKGR